VYSAATRKHGYNSPAFFDAVREVGALGREGLKNNGHIAALEAWLEEHLGRG
jgi:dihydroorotate dehydrogenase